VADYQWHTERATGLLKDDLDFEMVFTIGKKLVSNIVLLNERRRVPQRFQVICGKQAAGDDQEIQSLQELPTFEEALLAHLDTLFAFAMRLAGGERALAEDLVQEVCLRAFKNYKSLRVPEKFKTWLFQILVNTRINAFHRKAREMVVVDIELNETLLGAGNLEPVLTPEDHLFGQLLDGEVQQALDSLPVEFSTVVWLSDVEELSYKEIAEVINCPIGTVASRLYRGHSLMREQLREYARQHGLLKE
jgi:RNA polymerase sigma-70 factor (ECF subfamily)